MDSLFKILEDMSDRIKNLEDDVKELKEYKELQEELEWENRE